MLCKGMKFKMELTICHLYPDLLNTYGDFGNLALLKARCEARGISANIQSVSVDDALTAQRADIIFLGGGQDFEQTIAAGDLMEKKRDAIKDFVEDGGTFLGVCGGFQLMGEFYETPRGEKLAGLNILPFHTTGGKKRLIGNIMIKDGENTYVGFENHSGKTYTGSLPPLGTVLCGFGNNGEDKKEGCVYKNAVCTYLHGPLLSKNPELSDRLLASALERKYGKADLAPIDDELELAAKEAMVQRLSQKV